MLKGPHVQAYCYNNINSFPSTNQWNWFVKWNSLMKKRIAASGWNEWMNVWIEFINQLSGWWVIACAMSSSIQTFNSIYFNKVNCFPIHSGNDWTEWRNEEGRMNWGKHFALHIPSINLFHEI